MPCAVKSSFLNRFTDLSLEINLVDSNISFDKKLVFTLQIGDNFFLNSNSVTVFYDLSITESFFSGG